jgi:flagellar biosynthesis regulator FlaF
VTEGRFENEKEIRRFLLGEMTDGERTAFEEKFIAEDSGLFDEINVAEDELIESYIRGTLSSTEKRKFEQNFLISETRRQRVAFTREMFDKLAADGKSAAKKIEAVAESPSVWNSITQFFKTPRLAFGAALVILILVFGFWLLVFKPSEKRNEIVQQITPTPTISNTPQKVEENQNVAVDSNVSSANAPETNKNSPSNSQENPNKNQLKEAIPKPIVATIALFAGTVRSEGKMRVLELTKDTKGANFELNLENSDYKTYRAEIVNADGNVIYRSGKINARRSKLNAFFPTAKLKKGDYFVKLYGFNSSDEEESAADFQFRVNQK